MSSIFNIPQSPGELVSANKGTANAQYRQITATRDVTGNQFPNGIIQFRFETGGNTWFMPSMSYFRIRAKLTSVATAAAAPIAIQSLGDVAPNMGMAANLFKSCEVRLNGQTVERVSERLPQVDALKTRKGKSKAWLDSIGKSTNYWDYDFASRQQDVSVDGYETSQTNILPAYGEILTAAQAGLAGTSITYIGGVLTFTGGTPDILNGPGKLREGDLLTGAGNAIYLIVRVITATTARVQVQNDVTTITPGAEAFTVLKIENASRNDVQGKNSFELVWQPPLGFFDVPHAIPPGGSWTVEFNPENASQFKKNAIESDVKDRDVVTSPTVAGQFDFEIIKFEMYLYTVDSARFDNGSYFLDIHNMRCQIENMQNDSTSLQQKNFDVAGKTTALTLAFQDQLEGTDTRRSRSKFKIRRVTNAAAGADAPRGQDMLLDRFYINYNNMQKPSPDFDGQYVSQQGNMELDQVNQLTHRYVDTMMQSGGYHTEGGAETFLDWINRGPYYYFVWPKDAVENNTRVNVNYKFSQAFDGATNHKILLFNEWRTAYHIVHKNGRVESLSVEEL